MFFDVSLSFVLGFTMQKRRLRDSGSLFQRFVVLVSFLGALLATGRQLVTVAENSYGKSCTKIWILKGVGTGGDLSKMGGHLIWTDR